MGNTKQLLLQLLMIENVPLVYLVLAMNLKLKHVLMEMELIIGLVKEFRIVVRGSSKQLLLRLLVIDSVALVQLVLLVNLKFKHVLMEMELVMLCVSRFLRVVLVNMSYMLPHLIQM